ncbi:hypothetical protein PBAC_07340 [Pedobacter glucosidilyticus]|nr:hypothetical protein [Pedobacter glucosidilyticus]KHJ39134.1 hypothetical protein PBAC_07340 [Pedobacter glucosidilyticus]
MVVKVLKPTDCSKVAELHLEAFSSFFLTSLGKSFLVVFYKAIIKHKNGIALGIYENEKLLAFAVGTTKKRGFYTSIIKSSAFKLLLFSLPALIKTPTNILKLFKSLITNETTEETLLDNASLLSICVNPLANHRGLGKKILVAFEESVFFLANSISLTTDAIDNEYVNLFYKKNGYILLKQYSQGKRKMNLYNKQKNA